LAVEKKKSWLWRRRNLGCGGEEILAVEKKKSQLSRRRNLAVEKKNVGCSEERVKL
jgi:hypothetical protein